MDKEIRYSSHLQYRLKIRNFEPDLPRRILNSSKTIYYDTATANNIAVAWEFYAGKLRELAVAFVEKSA